MLDDTYEASGYHYGVLASNNEIVNTIISCGCQDIYSPEDFGKFLDNLRRHGTFNIIEFESIDGLTIGDLKKFKCFNDDFLLFCMYDMVDCYNDSCGRHLSLSENLIFHLNTYSDDTMIDNLIADSLIQSINSGSKGANFNRRAKCFFLLFKYGTKQKSDDKIKSMKNQ